MQAHETQSSLHVSNAQVRARPAPHPFILMSTPTYRHASSFLSSKPRSSKRRAAWTPVLCRHACSPRASSHAALTPSIVAGARGTRGGAGG